nr:MAG TPA: hypothetical protein [Caudoviricetes sp.]
MEKDKNVEIGRTLANFDTAVAIWSTLSTTSSSRAPAHPTG